MQRLVDSAVGVAKESVKTLTREAFNNTINLVNGASAFVLEFVPGKGRASDSLQGLETRPTLKAPRLPQWMEDGYSSFNKFIYDNDFSDEASDTDYDSGTESDVSEASLPSSPSSNMSYHSSGSGYLSATSLSRSRLIGRRQRPLLQLLKRIFWLFFWPFLIFFPRKRHNRKPSGGAHPPPRSSSSGTGTLPSEPRPLSRSSSTSSLSRHFSLASQEFSKRLNDVMEYVTHLNDNRRRGIIEDLQIALELAIERVFETVRGILHYSISPWTSIQLVVNGLMGRRVPPLRTSATVTTTTLGDSKTNPMQRPVRLAEALNMDARSCEDVITDAGYPYECRKVTTKDGYVLTLERIPRRDSRKVVLLQHGLLDSSLGWVSNGPVGSQAFAAYDQGFDVWLGNLRGYANREHVNKRISARDYWRYSINEHGMYDIGAMVECIHGAKLGELRAAFAPHDGSSNGLLPDGGSPGDQPYMLSGVAHSLGGAAVMLYVVTKRMRKEAHRFSRLILLSPAGFHEKVPFLFNFLAASVPFVEPIMTRFMPGLFIPTRGLRLIFNKLVQDFQNLPALKALIQVLLSSVAMGGDTSDWVGALRQPHYNMYDMPGLAFGVIKHMHQLWISRKFLMFDYGSARANMAAYGQPKPIDVAANYNLFDIPVDVVMGRKDAIIPPAMVIKHYQALKAGGRTASIKEFEFAHLDFTFAQHQELLAYVMARLNLPASTSDLAALRGSRSPSLTVRTSLTPTGQNERQVAAAPAAGKQQVADGPASVLTDFTAALEESSAQAVVDGGLGTPDRQLIGESEDISAVWTAEANGNGTRILNGTGEYLGGQRMAKILEAHSEGKGASENELHKANRDATDGSSVHDLSTKNGPFGSGRYFDANDEYESDASLRGRQRDILHDVSQNLSFERLVENGSSNRSLQRKLSGSKSRRTPSVTEIEEIDDSQDALDTAKHRWKREASTGSEALTNGNPGSGLVVQVTEIANGNHGNIEAEDHTVNERPWITDSSLTSGSLRQRIYQN